jgi:hypothetical protein
MIGTLADLKAYLEAPPAKDDALLTRLLEAASGLVCGQIGREFGVANHELERYLGEGGATLALAHTPVAEVTELRIGGDVIPKAVDAARDEGWFAVRDLLCVRGAYEFKRYALIEVSYSAGEAPPAELVQAVYEIAALKYRERQHIGTASQTVAGQSVSFLPSIIPVSVQVVIDSYQLPRF